MRKKILYHSDFSLSKTGFGKTTKNILSYLYKTGKYDIVEYAVGMPWSDPRGKMLPWKFRGALPDNQVELAYLNQNGRKDEGLERLVYYGSHNIDRVIKEEKPDVYIGVQDPWAFTGYTDKPWWNKINSILHITIDSLPLYPEAIKQSSKTHNYLVWAKFAEEAFRKIGHNHVRAIPGAIDHKSFFRLSDLEKTKLRERHNLPKDAFIGGFVFRNQLRKSCPNLLDGFSQFLKRNPSCNAYLILHTNYEDGGGWRIPDLVKEYNIPNERILTTYICRHCREYEIKPFTTPDTDCRFCGVKANQGKDRTGQRTTGVDLGVTEFQLNEIYNLMDIKIQAFSSGGLEIPIIESKLTEKITLVTNYSCGTETCTDESGGIALDYHEYREPGSQFIKATTNPFSIVKGMEKVWNMKPSTRREMEKRARRYAIDNYSVESVGRRFEELIDSLPKISLSEEEWSFTPKPKNPSYPFKNEIIDDKEWVKDLYKNILNMEVSDDDAGLKHWVKVLGEGGRK